MECLSCEWPQKQEKEKFKKKREREDGESKNRTGKDWMRDKMGLLSSQPTKTPFPTRQFHQEGQLKAWAQS